MRAVVQRVLRAEVEVDGQTVGSVGPGMLALLAVERDDGPKDLEWIKRKLINLRIFPDQEGLMNLPLSSVGGAILLVSQFTLYGDCRKGNRPSYIRSAAPEWAENLYEKLADALRSEGIEVATGRFGASMRVSLVNDGPVTLIIDSRA